MSKHFRVSLVSIVTIVFVFISAQLLSIQTARAAVSPIPIIAQGRSDLPKIALTFDDGPDPTYTPQVLSVLARYNIHATFFEMGNHVQHNPVLVHHVIQSGNIIGNHSWDHPEFTKLAADALTNEITSTSMALYRTTGIRPTLIRPPYGALNETVKEQIAAQHLTTILWDIDPQDWSRPGTDAIVNNVLSHAHNGAIILMHDGGGNRSQTVAALSQIIPALQQKGYHFVTVPVLMQDLRSVA